MPDKYIENWSNCVMKKFYILLGLFKIIYETGEISKQWLLSAFVLILKKPNPGEFSNYRPVSPAVKLFLQINHKRIYTRREKDISNTQSSGVQELFEINILFQRCLDTN